ADHATAIGERRMLTLADGSTIILDADSAADVVMDAGRREVVLRRGRAFFDVAKTGAPFIVKAAQGEIRVVGTRFEVARFGDCAAVVTVEEGAVSVTPPAGSPQALTPGTRLRFNRHNAKPPEAAERSVAAWRQGRLSFDDAPVREIVEEINRYHPARIVLLSDEIGKRRLSGSLPADDPAAALEGLADALGLSRIDLAGQVILLK
ncbi:MAG TPA: FecR domain-containing protein, partial [Azospirillaceae bacterium]|nr:FecR domain-containing protein [Azospirillaceae bacterium]